MRRDLVPLVVCLLVAGATVQPAVPVTAQPVRPDGRWVTVRPVFGAYRAPFREWFTDAELGVMSGLANEVRTARNGTAAPVNTGIFHVEPGSARSPLYLAQRTVLTELQRVLEKYDGMPADWRVHVVVGRTQRWMKSTLRRLGCRADLTSTDGVLEMGAALCGRRFVTSNLTGYLFLRTPADTITPSLETVREPSPSAVPYLVALRNLSGLAHEWAHSHRAAAQSGRVLEDEPAWMREGTAEFLAGLAIVNAYRGRMTYTDWHAIRLRRFLEWATRCNASLSTVRWSSERTNGCEYFIGPVAVELLVARHGGIESLVRVFGRHEPERGFLADFEDVYGMTLAEFEQEADAYIAGIRAAELAG